MPVLPEEIEAASARLPGNHVLVKRNAETRPSTRESSTRDRRSDLDGASNEGLSPMAPATPRMRATARQKRLKLVAGLEAELLDQRPARVAVDGKGVPLPPGPVEREHQLREKTLTEQRVPDLGRGRPSRQRRAREPTGGRTIAVPGSMVAEAKGQSLSAPAAAARRTGR